MGRGARVGVHRCVRQRLALHDLLLGETLRVRVDDDPFEPTCAVQHRGHEHEFALDLLCFTGRQGEVTRIDLRLAPGTELDRVLAELALPAQVIAQRPAQAGERISNLSRAYRVNLTVLALVALFTGAFLVFSVLSLSVARRQPQFALLGVLGLSGQERLRLVLAESALLGLIGSALGIALGTALAAANGVIDENVWLAAFLSGRIDRNSSFSTNAYANWYQSGDPLLGDTRGLGATAAYYRSITSKLSATAAVGVDGVVRPDVFAVGDIARYASPTYARCEGRPEALTRVSVFMNVFNCHVNRMPVAGQIDAIAYRPGATHAKTTACKASDRTKAKKEGLRGMKGYGCRAGPEAAQPAWANHIGER